MPIVDGKVTFNATLFALVRTTLKIHCQGMWYGCGMILRLYIYTRTMRIHIIYIPIHMCTYTYTHTHTHTHTVGCPDCTRKCNIDLHDKLKILFPNMANKRIIAVIPTENGKNDAI